MAPESSSARVPAPCPLPETSTTTTSRRSPTREATTKSPAKGVPPAERSSEAAYHSGGRAGMPPWRRMRSRRSTNICSPWRPGTPSRERRNEESSTSRPRVKMMTMVVPILTLTSTLITIRASTKSTNTTNHGS